MIDTLTRLGSKVARKIDQFARLDAHLMQGFSTVRAELEANRMLTAKSLIHQMKAQGIYERIQEAEFKVFSQFGDDGIIQYLLHHLAIQSETFIEFGVEDYRESNTRFLLLNNNWKGLVLDQDEAAIQSIQRDSLYLLHDLTAAAAFIERDNINQLFTRYGFTGDIGLLSIDIDGNDYWVWDAINVVNPVVVVAEYNSLLGDSHALVVPYDPSFYRTRAHYSNMYYGASLKAFCLLAAKKGYAFVGSNSMGNNAYFVRQDHLGPLRPLTAQEGYVATKIRETRDPQGRLTFVSGRERLRPIAAMPILDLERGELVKVGEVLAL